tara:strand:- start:5660 stop:5866 length:207 start_codon:yes stop_codon:yes gene_type:complete
MMNLRSLRSLSPMFVMGAVLLSLGLTLLAGPKEHPRVAALVWVAAFTPQMALLISGGLFALLGIKENQ